MERQGAEGTHMSVSYVCRRFGPGVGETRLQLRIVPSSGAVQLQPEPGLVWPASSGPWQKKAVCQVTVRERNVYDAWQAHKFTHEKLRIPPQSPCDSMRGMG